MMLRTNQYSFRHCNVPRNAYIVVAMKGTSLCTSIKEAFQLILANVARVATVGIISNFLLLLGKLFIVSVCCICMFLFIDNPPSSFPAFVRGDLDNISSPVFPMIVCFFGDDGFDCWFD